MAELQHSPAPFELDLATDKRGHIIVDALGDSIGILAARTGDHSEEEQLANAWLFKASPRLLANAKTIIWRLLREERDVVDRHGGIFLDLADAIAEAEFGS